MDHGDTQQWQISQNSVMSGASHHVSVSKIFSFWQKVGYPIMQLVKRGT